MKLSDIAKRLKELRLSHDYSIYYLSQKSGISQNQLSRIENGTACPRVDTLEKLLQVYQCTLSEFFNEDTALIMYPSDKEQSYLKQYRALSDTQREAIDIMITELNKNHSI